MQRRGRGGGIYKGNAKYTDVCLVLNDKSSASNVFPPEACLVYACMKDRNS